MKFSLSFSLLALFASQLCCEVESSKRKRRASFFIVIPTEFGFSENVARHNELSQETTQPLSDSYKKIDLERDSLELKPPQQFSTSSTRSLQQNHLTSRMWKSLPLPSTYGLWNRALLSRSRRFSTPSTFPSKPTFTTPPLPSPVGG